MNNTLKKTGSILFCLLPALLAFGIQLAVSVPAAMIKIFMVIAKDPDIFSDMETYFSTIMSSMDSTFLCAVSGIYAVIAALVMGFWYWKKFAPKKVPKRSPGQIINLKMFGGLLALMLGMQYLSTYIVNLLYLINPEWYDTYEYLMESMGFAEVTWVLALYSVIIAPISEELIFRGVTMHYAKNTMPFWLANIFQAFLFGVFHGNVIQGVYAFVVGLFCGYVCHRGGSIYLSILYHMLFNLWGTFAPGNLTYTGDSTIIHIFIFLLTVVVTFVGFYLYHSGTEQRKSVEKTIPQDV